MSEFFELLERYCGEGVEWKLLGDIAEIGTGKSDAREGLKEGLYPFYTCAKELLRKNEYEFDETAIIIVGSGSNAGKIFHYIEGKYALLQRTYRVCIQTPALLPKFCYYYICSSLPAHIEKYINKGAIPNILRPMLTDFPVPLPPLEVQR